MTIDPVLLRSLMVLALGVFLLALRWLERRLPQ